MLKRNKTGGRVAGEEGVKRNLTVRASPEARKRYAQRATEEGFKNVAEWVRATLDKALSQPVVLKCGCYSDACYCGQTPPNTDIDWVEDGGH